MARGALGRPDRGGPSAAEAVAFLGALVLLEAAAVKAAGPLGLTKALWITGAIRVGELLGTAVYWRCRGWGLKDLGLDAPAARRGWLVGALAAAGFGALVLAAEAGGRTVAGWSPLRHLAGGGAPAAREGLALLVVGGLVAPAFEELVFRGVLYGALRRRVGVAAATGLAAGLFAAAHALRTPVPWVQAVGGIVFCAVYEASGSLWAPFLVHAAGNLALFLLPLALA